MKPPNKIRRRESRDQRRREWDAERAAFLLAGGHKDWVIPFHMNWRHELPHQIRSIEEGDPYFTQPRGYYHGYSGTTTGRDRYTTYTQTVKRR